MEPLNYHIIHTFLIVSGNCEICKERIERVALSISGVESASWNISDGRLSLTFDPRKADLDQISLAIVKAGHDTSLHKVGRDVECQMPNCCKQAKEG